MKKIVVLGSFIVDLMARTPHLPSRGETVKGSAFTLGPGGKGSNQAIACKRTGGDVQFITKVGKDEFGKLALNTFKKENISTDNVFIDEKLSTGAALIMVDEESSENEIVVTLGACENLTSENINTCENIIKESDLLLIQLETNVDAVEKVIKIAHDNNVKVILNPAPIQNISEDVLKLVNIITPNEVEAGILTNMTIKSEQDASKAAKILQEKGIENIIITLGSKGVFVKSNDEEKFIKSYKVKAIDTTGAGDAFNGGFVTALSEGNDIFHSAHFGNAVAALSVTKIGTSVSMPSRKEVDDFMKNFNA